MDDKEKMTKKLLSAPCGQWFKLTDRKDIDVVLALIYELIEVGYKFLLSPKKDRFMRVSIDLFEWAESRPEGSDVRVKVMGSLRIYELYYNEKLIAIR